MSGKAGNGAHAPGAPRVAGGWAASTAEWTLQFANVGWILERETGIEPATYSLGNWRSIENKEQWHLWPSF